jgi:putative heme-binding domain-containing protein
MQREGTVRGSRGVRIAMHALCGSLMLSCAIVIAQAPVPGDAARGRAIVNEKSDCLRCHGVMGHGSRLGPNLSTIGDQRTAAQLKAALLDPLQTPNPQYRLYKIVTKDGKTVTGKLLNQDMYRMQMLDAHENLVAFSRSNIREKGFVNPTPMPSYRGKLSDDEIADVVAYLASLKSGAPQGGNMPTMSH